jgi:hypothetical protein
MTGSVVDGFVLLAATGQATADPTTMPASTATVMIFQFRDNTGASYAFKRE